MERFTDMYIKKLKPADKEYWRREGQGFAIRVLPTGVKCWYYIYTFEGRKRYMPLGEGNYPDVSLADARGYFDDAKKKVKNGIDPLEEKKRAALERKQTPLVADFIDEYIKSAKKKLKRWQDVERALNVEVRPRWGKRKITDITRRDITTLRNEIEDRGAPIMANRCLAYVSGMFAFAVEESVIQESPYTNIKRAKKEEPKDRALSVDEIKQLWTALDGDTLMMSTEIKTALKLILLTAQRPGEVIGMHSSELGGHWWTIPKERAKNGKAHRVYLSKTALSLIGDTKGKGYIFPSVSSKVSKATGKEGCITVNALSFAIRRNIKGQAVRTDKVKRRKGEGYKRGPYNSKALPENSNRIGIESFTPHDLRRTAATLMAAEKVPYEVRERVLNHTMGKLDATYNAHDFDDEKQMAMQTIERKINSIITGKQSDNVILLQRRA